MINTLTLRPKADVKEVEEADEVEEVEASEALRSGSSFGPSGMAVVGCVEVEGM
jgi:hypothetical protein